MLVPERYLYGLGRHMQIAMGVTFGDAESCACPVIPTRPERVDALAHFFLHQKWASVFSQTRVQVNVSHRNPPFAVVGTLLLDEQFHFCIESSTIVVGPMRWGAVHVPVRRRHTQI